MQDHEILSLARDLRSVLPDIVLDADRRADLIGAIDAAERGEIEPLVLLHHLAGQADARQWLQARQVDLDSVIGYVSAMPPPPDAAPAAPLAGDPSAIATAAYLCPEPGCTEPPWHRQRIGQPVPECPVHHLARIPTP